MLLCLENAFHSDILFSSGYGHLDSSAHMFLTGDLNPVKLFPLKTTLLRLFNDIDCIQFGLEPIKFWPREADLTTGNTVYGLNVFNAHGSSSPTAYMHVYQHFRSRIHIFWELEGPPH